MHGRCNLSDINSANATLLLQGVQQRAFLCIANNCLYRVCREWLTVSNNDIQQEDKCWRQEPANAGPKNKNKIIKCVQFLQSYLNSPVQTLFTMRSLVLIILCPCQDGVRCQQQRAWLYNKNRPCTHERFNVRGELWQTKNSISSQTVWLPTALQLEVWRVYCVLKMINLSKHFFQRATLSLRTTLELKASPNGSWKFRQRTSLWNAPTVKTRHF